MQLYDQGGLPRNGVAAHITRLGWDSNSMPRRRFIPAGAACVQQEKTGPGNASNLKMRRARFRAALTTKTDTEGKGTGEHAEACMFVLTQ